MNELSVLEPRQKKEGKKGLILFDCFKHVFSLKYGFPFISWINNTISTCLNKEFVKPHLFQYRKCKVPNTINTG